MQVAQTAFTAFGKKGFFTVLIQVGNCLTGIQVGNHGSDRNTKLNIGSTSAVAVTAAGRFRRSWLGTYVCSDNRSEYSGFCRQRHK